MSYARRNVRRRRGFGLGQTKGGGTAADIASIIAGAGQGAAAIIGAAQGQPAVPTTTPYPTDPYATAYPYTPTPVSSPYTLPLIIGGVALAGGLIWFATSRRGVAANRRRRSRRRVSRNKRRSRRSSKRRASRRRVSRNADYNYGAVSHPSKYDDRGRTTRNSRRIRRNSYDGCEFMFRGPRNIEIECSTEGFAKRMAGDLKSLGYTRMTSVREKHRGL